MLGLLGEALETLQRFTFGVKFGLLDSSAHIGDARAAGGLCLELTAQITQRLSDTALPAPNGLELGRLLTQGQAVSVQPAVPQKFAHVDAGLVLQAQTGGLNAGASVEGEGKVPQRVGAKPGPQSGKRCGRIVRHEPVVTSRTTQAGPGAVAPPFCQLEPA